MSYHNVMRPKSVTMGRDITAPRAQIDMQLNTQGFYHVVRNTECPYTPDRGTEMS